MVLGSFLAYPIDWDCTHALVRKRVCIAAGSVGSVGVEPIHIDELRRQAGMPVANVSSTLSLLGIKGLVKQVGAMHYVRVREAAASYQPAN